ncbi:nucleolar protein dao-5-like [Planococcus citri]|uniref:nucleolar protein dao-5-like n=1 Tax=Planococcus citri TaxID=170843 RepID=UPI0031F7842E
MASDEEKLNPATTLKCEESAPGIFLPVFLTLVVVVAAMLIVYFFWKYYWRIRHGKHLVLVTDVEKAEPDFAFDNPGFREGTPVIQAKKLSAEIKEKAEAKENSQKLSNGHKPQSLEDGALNKAGTSSDQKTNVIPLKSKDFTGLGFDICGNMRDGIYVKDLLHRGPASETGMIKQGDRISAIRINFSHMVYEDAKAILSYASPYEVEIEVEDSSMTANADAKRSSPNSTHSFYRSQSFSTAQQIQKIVPRKLNFNSIDKKPEPAVESKPAILEVSEISDKMFKYGVKVLPDIKTKVNLENSTSSPSVTSSEIQRNANSTVIDIQSDSGIDTKTPTLSFDEVDLSPPVLSHHQPEKPPTGNSLTSTFKDNNMKTKLVKGIQNLKEKLNNHIQKSSEKISSKDSEMQKVEKKADEMQPASSPKTTSVSTTVEIVDDFKPQEDINLRLRSSSVSSNEDAAKKSKRKAPPPPVALADVEFNLLNEIENEVNKNNNYDCKDSDSEAEPDINTIELNSSHITVHHIPEESSRKAASLGDLSKITDTDSPVPLERAVSLELTEHTPRGSKKRKAPLPPEEDLSSEDVFLKDSKSDIGMTKLKKSSLFGTLEEAVKTKNGEDNCSISSDTNDNLLTSSTPMKLPDDDNKFLSIDSHCSNISWELNFDLQDESIKDSVFADIDEKVPDLPTSPMPNLPTYVTEIKVSNGGDDEDLSKVNISDLTLFVTAAEISSGNDKINGDESTNDDSKTLEFIESKTISNDTNHSASTMINDTSPVSSPENSTNDYENEDSTKDDSSIDTVKEMTYTNGVSEDHGSPKETSIELKNSTQKNYSKFSKENMSDEQILALNSNSTSNSTPNLKYSKIKSPSSTNKIPKLSQSVSPVKAAGSRIPIRANTEPSLKVSLINKDDIVVPKPRKYKLSEDGLENGKPATFASSNHLPSPTHKTAVLSETRHNGPNR